MRSKAAQRRQRVGELSRADAEKRCSARGVKPDPERVNSLPVSHRDRAVEETDNRSGGLATRKAGTLKDDRISQIHDDLDVGIRQNRR